MLKEFRYEDHSNHLFITAIVCPIVQCPPGYIVRFTSPSSYSRAYTSDIPPPRPRYSYQRYQRGGYAKGGFSKGGYSKGGYSKGGFSKGGYNRKSFVYKCKVKEKRELLVIPFSAIPFFVILLQVLFNIFLNTLYPRTYFQVLNTISKF